jgi:hypothetical protein
MKIGDRTYWIIMGGLTFWFPAIVLSAIFRENVSVLWLNVDSLMGLVVFGLMSWIRGRCALNWIWVLAGVHIFGPICILTASAFSGGIVPSWKAPGYLLFEVVVCLIPPMTLWMSLMSGMIVSVLIVTFVLYFLVVRRDKT